MKLKRIDKVYSYREKREITQYDLLTKYNPYFISKKIATLTDQIDDMYCLNMSHTEHTGTAYTAVSYPLDSLVIWIVEQKEALQRFKSRSTYNMELLKLIMKDYSPSTQKEIRRFMRTNGFFYPKQAVQTLIKDINENIKR